MNKSEYKKPVRVLDLSEQDILDEFTVDQFLGMGLSETAKVYSAKDKKALKLFVAPIGSQGNSFRLRKFIGEVECLKKLSSSKYVVEVITDYRSEGILNSIKVEAHYYAMEKMDINLEKHLLAQLDWPLESKLEVLEQVLNGLKDSHGADVFHRDLYTPNVLININGEELEAKLSDFGSAKQFTAKQENPYFEPTGNFQFTSPEACIGMLGGDNKDKSIFAAADIYSFGLLFYEVISGVKLEDINVTDPINYTRSLF